jgi:hypothetical protein
LAGPHHELDLPAVEEELRRREAALVASRASRAAGPTGRRGPAGSGGAPSRG